jgi:hypothetical protein
MTRARKPIAVEETVTEDKRECWATKSRNNWLLQSAVSRVAMARGKAKIEVKERGSDGQRRGFELKPCRYELVPTQFI